MCDHTLVNGVQTCILFNISPCGISHMGDVLVGKLEVSLESSRIQINVMLKGIAFDDEYFDLNVDKKLAKHSENLNHDFLLSLWDT